MLPQKNRLVEKKDFQKVYRERKSFKKGPLSLKFAKNNLNKTRVGFSFPKKFFKKAVERNRAKRIVREAIQEHLKKIKPGIDIVVFSGKMGKEDNFQKILKDTKELLKKSNLVKKNG